MGFLYNECLKNQAVSFGGYALDGCGEFMPKSTTISSQTLRPLVAMHVAATATSTAVTLPTSSVTVPTHRPLHHRCSQLHPRSTCFSLSAAQVSPDPRIKTWVK
ncbi:hypothetical protein F2Q70_00007761 [Brassica cretica]|uniref:ZF-HD dimerization-type domain-containing protein n=1 Tax=Brassica cretica TaxID=69181 RepID=A0A8S9MA21_BRACR|nr:hypothetical protein F2Q70_00007761 [Brassica cretica]